MLDAYIDFIKELFPSINPYTAEQAKASFSEYVADLNLITPFPKILVSKTLKEKREMKKYSLNLIGYYLLISKITVHFLRPEDSGTQKRRKIPE